jgi:hypothetical protein
LHVEVILALLVILVSLPALTNSFIFKTTQSLALIGMAFAVFLSVLIGLRWAGGAVRAFLLFIPNIFAYFLVCLHCNSKKKLQFLVLMLLFVCFFVIAHGCIDLLHGVPANGPPRGEDADSGDLNLWQMQHPYLLAMGNDAREGIYRLRGLGLINDPNDFGQLVVCLIPLVFIFWRPKGILQNTVFVVLPVCVLLYGVYLTHSRGALLALMAVLIVAARRRIGTLVSLLIAGGAFVGAMALQFTGGRGISAGSGADRTELWGEGLQLLKSHPLFGSGFGNMSDLTSSHLTAHNSIVVCAAELGLFGLYFWAMFLFPTVRDALASASPAKVNEEEPIIAEEDLLPGATTEIQGVDTAEVEIDAVDKIEVKRLGRLVVLSLTGFLVAGFFLSRAYVMTLFLLGGMAEVVYEMALQRGIVGPRLALSRLMGYAGGLTLSMVLMMYITVRALNLVR